MDLRKFIIDNKIIILAILILILIAAFTHYNGSTDIGDYADSAKYFAGYFHASMRNSHSYVFGFIHSPFVKLTENYLSFKISSIIFLLSIVFSVYYLTGKNKKMLLLVLFSPIIWYMSPWINPIQISSLLLLWAYHFITIYKKEENLKYLISSGLLIGLSICFWNTALYFGIVLMLSFLYNKKSYHVLFYLISILIGLTPLFLIDFLLFGFPFYTLIKTNIAQFLFTFLGKGIYESSINSNILIDRIFVLLFFPFYFWLVFKPSNFKEEKNSVIFISLSILIILSNPQIRYTLAIFPIILLFISKELDEKRIKKYLIFSTILIILISTPYIIQINYSINNKIEGTDFYTILKDKSFLISIEFPSELIKKDLNEITLNYKNQTFLVLGSPDDYQILADLYWKSGINEFVSIQDYELYLSNKTVLFEKTFMPIPRINDRRQIWITGGISKNQNDFIDYKNIKYAVSIKPANPKDFRLIKRYNLLYLYEKIR